MDLSHGKYLESVARARPAQTTAHDRSRPASFRQMPTGRLSRSMSMTEQRTR